MIEQLFKLNMTDDKTIERIIADENVHYNHMLFGKGEGLPEHFANSTLYMTVLRGKLSLGLDDQEFHAYDKGSLLKIPVNTKMNIKNFHDEIVEITVVKAPAPTN